MVSQEVHFWHEVSKKQYDVLYPEQPAERVKMNGQLMDIQLNVVFKQLLEWVIQDLGMDIWTIFGPKIHT